MRFCSTAHWMAAHVVYRITTVEQIKRIFRDNAIVSQAVFCVFLPFLMSWLKDFVSARVRA